MINNSKQAIAVWKVFIGSLPRGIATFVIAIAGLSVGLSLAIFFIGLPILAGMLIVCERLLGVEIRLLKNWENPANESKDEPFRISEIRHDQRLKGWRGWMEVLGNPQYYRSLAYGIGQFPVSILAFVMAIIIPATGFGLMLSPAAEWVSTHMFAFDLFEKDMFMNGLFPDWTSQQRAWFNTGLGVILVAATPFLLRKLGGLYSAWIHWISGQRA
ncbi:sensor domain-containing protein [Cohnella terricola]|uniref:Putative sensor domain-containing protein n=1 Tax=Cohnella terricola TaxID=1289167 RepID=A0A559JFX4_9BACL|nr:sensor domain-containing protein [Cohnella terricola]TVX98784.1 hypothetical protein FPZ45_15945 [Cohnella terricola]